MMEPDKQKSKTILVIEDEPDVAESLEAKLRLEGYAVQLASDGEAGVEKARAVKPDLILMDLMMPKLNGAEACKILKEHPQTKNIPIIVLTASQKVESVELSFVVGADDFLNKPYTNDLLLQKIKKHLP
ncbi:MAG: hypothetical protein A2901_08775 [Elusimicrobia bacterium RIFCSPLOWO2_01_FULL_54_10]|nr:MAG: hypothetical protein A2901_08775 [Elusimicrobia bacterium RIFCSPLOWO2_01_FULL_54_10]